MEPIIDRDTAARMADKLHQQHAARLGTARIEVEGWRTADKVIVRLTLARPDKTLYYPMEAGALLEGGTKADVAEKLTLAVDFLAYYLEQYLDSDGEVLLPLDWKAVSFGDKEVYAKGWERNLALEEAADRWLQGDHELPPELQGKGRRERRPR